LKERFFIDLINYSKKLSGVGNMFKDKVAIVTGASRGIGNGIATSLAKNGAKVICWGTREDTAKAAAEKIAADTGAVVIGRAVNVTDFSGVESAIKAIHKEYGQIDILVNNAGITRDNIILRMKEEDWDNVININLKGAFNCTRAAARFMLKARAGSIVNIASVIGLMGNAGQANYAASKAGVIGFTKSAAREFAARGVRVNAIAPGFIRTDMTDELSDEVKEATIGQIPLGCYGEVEDIASAVEFLVSDSARYITGQVLTVDGGMVM
jgi:3-oxoacyl-[acyl-carrier protein] reductase